jgi:hypothetical protein
MQPVAQINLERAGKLLGEKLGDGLVQCWAVTRTKYLSQCEPLIRTIPQASLPDAMNNIWPEGAAWNPPREDNGHGGISRREECWYGQRVEWIPMGRKFPDPMLAMVGDWPRSAWDLRTGETLKGLRMRSNKQGYRQTFIRTLVRLRIFGLGDFRMLAISMCPSGLTGNNPLPICH